MTVNCLVVYTLVVLSHALTADTVVDMSSTTSGNSEEQQRGGAQVKTTRGVRQDANALS